MSWIQIFTLSLMISVLIATLKYISNMFEKEIRAGIIELKRSSTYHMIIYYNKEYYTIIDNITNEQLLKVQNVSSWSIDEMQFNAFIKAQQLLIERYPDYKDLEKITTEIKLVETN